MQGTGGCLTSTLTIAHISDLHLSAEHGRKNIQATKHLLEYIGNLGADHLVITGDIAANAVKRDFQVARAILKGSGWLDSKLLSVVIGNHDIFGGVHHAEDILTFPRHCKHTDYKEKVSEFYDYFHEAFDRCIQVGDSSLFPYGKVVGDVVIVGINSVAKHSSVGNPIGSNGVVDDRQFLHAAQILSSELLKGKTKVVLIHHHFYKRKEEDHGTIHSIWSAIESQTMKLRGKKKLLKLFAESGVDLVLHGHLHENREYSRKGIHCLNGGGSVLEYDGKRLQCNLIRISEGLVQVEHIVIPGRSKGRGRSVPESGIVTHAAA